MDRKEIVKALEMHFQVKAKYMGTPSFAYQIEADGSTLTIDRNGKITDANGNNYEVEEVLKATQGTISKEQTEDVGFEVIVDMVGHTGTSLKNLIYMLYSKQQFIKTAFGREEDLIKTELVEKMKERKVVEIQDFIVALNGMNAITHRGLHFDFEKKQITFRFHDGDIETDKVNTYIQFVSLVNEKAKEIKCASSKVTISDNPKYTFRTWLLRLGMIGDEYKVARKVLLANLEGNIAFRDKK